MVEPQQKKEDPQPQDETAASQVAMHAADNREAEYGMETVPEEEKKAEKKPADDHLGAAFAGMQEAKDQAEKVANAEISRILSAKKAKNKALKKISGKKDERIDKLEEENATLMNDMAKLKNDMAEQTTNHERIVTEMSSESNQKGAMLNALRAEFDSFKQEQQKLFEDVQNASSQESQNIQEKIIEAGKEGTYYKLKTLRLTERSIALAQENHDLKTRFKQLESDMKQTMQAQTASIAEDRLQISQQVKAYIMGIQVSARQSAQNELQLKDFQLNQAGQQLQHASNQISVVEQERDSLKAKTIQLENSIAEMQQTVAKASRQGEENELMKANFVSLEAQSQLECKRIDEEKSLFESQQETFRASQEAEMRAFQEKVQQSQEVNVRRIKKELASARSIKEDLEEKIRLMEDADELEKEELSELRTSHTQLKEKHQDLQRFYQVLQHKLSSVSAQ